MEYYSRSDYAFICSRKDGSWVDRQHMADNIRAGAVENKGTVQRTTPARMGKVSRRVRMLGFVRTQSRISREESLSGESRS